MNPYHIVAQMGEYLWIDESDDLIRLVSKTEDGRIFTWLSMSKKCLDKGPFTIVHCEPAKETA